MTSAHFRHRVVGAIGWVGTCSQVILESGSRRAVMPIAVISGSQLNTDSLRQPWVMAGLGFLRGGKLDVRWWI
jgi:hypothetical protein